MEMIDPNEGLSPARSEQPSAPPAQQDGRFLLRLFRIRLAIGP